MIGYRVENHSLIGYRVHMEYATPKDVIKIQYLTLLEREQAGLTLCILIISV